MTDLEAMVKRKDLFSFIRYTMYYADMYSFHLERHLPHLLSGLGILVELIFELFLYFVTVHIVILYMCTIYLNYHKGDLELLVNCLIQTIIYWWTIIMKLYFRRIQPKRLEDLIDFINLNYKTRSAIGFTYVTMDGSLAMSNRWIKTYVYCCFLGTIFWLILPIAYGDRSLPLACWYPFDYKQPFVYETMYFLQSVGQIQVAAAFSASSGFHMVLGILISGQYDVLFCSLKNILATVAINRCATKKELRELYELQEFTAPEINEYYCSREITCDINTLVRTNTNNEQHDFRHHFRNAIKKCVDHHRYIVDCLNKMEAFYSPIWFFKTGEVIFLMCLVAFVSVKSTTANSSFMKAVSLGQYLVLVAWELLIICYFGEMIYINSQRCGEALLRCPWYIHMREMKYDFLLFLLNSKRPFKLTAGKIYTLNVERFKGRKLKNKNSVLNFPTNKNWSKTVVKVEMEDGEKPIKRQDLFTFVRFIMYYGYMYSFHLERLLPKELRGLGILLELVMEIFLYFVTFHIAIMYMCTIYLNFHKGDLELFVNCLMQTIIYLWTIIVKLYFRRMQPKRLEDLFNFINLKYKTRSAIGKCFTYITMDKIIIKSNKWTKVYSYSCFLGTIFWSILPITFGDRSLPLACWYPFDYKQPIIYEIIYFLQFIGQTQVSAAFSASSGFYMTLCILITGQYDILFCSLKNVLATVAINRREEIELRKLYKLQKSEIGEYYCSQETTCDIDTLVRSTKISKREDFGYHFNNALKKCINHHRYIIECLHKMEDFFCPIWFFKTGEIISVLCLVAFVSVKSTSANSIMKIVSLAQYLFLVIWELLIICYFGELIYINSQRCGEALMRSPWYIYMCDIKFDYIFVLLNSKRPFQLTAGKIITLNIECFKSVILYICTIFLNYHTGDLELLVNCLMQTVIYLWTIVMKLYFRRMRPKKLEDLMDFINFNCKQRSAIGFTYVTMDDTLAMSNKWIKLYLYSCYLCAICWLILPITYGDRSLPLTCWYPFDYQLPEFEVQEVNEYYCSKEIVSDVDTLETSATYRGERRDFRYHFRNAFKNCIDHHRYILECLKKMDDFYSIIWFFKTGEVIFLMCLVAFVAVKTINADTSYMKILSLANYLLLVAVEMLVICYFGEVITINSQRCGEAVMRSSWYIHMREMKTDFLIFLLNTNKPFKLSAGRIYFLNVECFKSLLKLNFLPYQAAAAAAAVVVAATAATLVLVTTNALSLYEICSK
ncbi:putative odorant receptor 83a [Lucilia cuprina]|uniref:Putative odorant receptor 83a n=1 Tax=Lucilia cuprina TaxID=7375 RepID=A0A0L0CDU2_LUCCU|nr:putative odorant receptor 83a [Lucilia cuprina]